MKYLFLLLPVLAISCSQNPDAENQDVDQRTIDSLATTIEANNDSTRIMLDHLPRVSAMISPTSAMIHPGESFEAKVLLAGNLLFYTMDKVVTVNNVVAPVSRNVATYRMKTTQEGLVTYNGVVKMRRPDGIDDEYPFTGSYYVTASAAALPTYSDSQLDSIYRTTIKIPRGTFPGKGPAYEPWLNSTLNFNKQNVQDAESLNRILRTQDSIITDLKEVHEYFKLDHLDVVIAPVSAVVKPGDEYVAFIYVAGTSSAQEIEIRSGTTTNTGARVAIVNAKPDGTGIQEYRGTLFYELFDKRDSIELNARYFVEEKK